MKNASKKIKLNWKVFKSSVQFYKSVRTVLTFTQSEIIRRTTDNLIKLGLIEEKQREEVAKQLAKWVLKNQSIASNLREIAACVARSKSKNERIKNGKKILSFNSKKVLKVARGF